MRSRARRAGGSVTTVALALWAAVLKIVPLVFTPSGGTANMRSKKVMLIRWGGGSWS